MKTLSIVRESELSLSQNHLMICGNKSFAVVSRIVYVYDRFGKFY